MNTIEVAYQRYCRERFPLPTETQVRALENRLGIDLPSDYRDFLLMFNGGFFTEPEIAAVSEGCPQDALSQLRGIGASHETAELGALHTMDSFDDNDPPKILSIGDTAMGGLIILDTAPGEGRGDIYLKKAFGDFYYLAAGIEEFFSLLRVRQSIELSCSENKRKKLTTETRRHRGMTTVEGRNI